MDILKFTSTIGPIGLILYVLGRFNKNKKWSNPIMTIGITLMAVQIIIEAGLGAYDGWSGNPHR